MSTEITDEQHAAIEAIRPLGATQNRNLLRIIETDYQMLRQQVSDFADEQLAAKKKEIRAAQSEGPKRELEDKMREIAIRYTDEMRALSRTAEDAGFTIHYPSVMKTDRYEETKFTVDYSRLNKELKDAEEQINEDKRVALSSLYKAEMEAKRVVFQASVSKDAEKVQKSLPTAQDAMIAAAQERATKEIA